MNNPRELNQVPETKLKHFCGVVGIYSPEEINLPQQLYFPLFSIQHRGQESAGISYWKKDHIVAYKDLGMVSSVLGHYLTGDRPSKVGIGHVRYSTHGGNKLENAQPILINCNKGEISLAHNGNLANTKEIKDELFSEGSIFQTSSDTELILHLISRSKAPNFKEALIESLLRLKGAFSMVMLHEDELIAIRDPWGYRPLYHGNKDGKHFIASETVAFDILQVDDYRSVEPGEVLFISDKGIRSEYLPKQKKQQCVFELIYFARPDSEVFDIPVHEKRKEMGRVLAKKDKDLMANSDLDTIVIPVPDSGNSAALGYAQEAGIEFDLGLTRNHYTGRSFIMPTVEARELVVRMKLNPIRHVIRGKRVFLVDDSLVRGTTAKMLVKLVKEAGAAEVHLRLSSPEIRWPCFFGIDIPTRKELISNSKTPREIAEFTGANSVQFLEIEDLQSIFIQPKHFCYSCFSGKYKLEVPLNLVEKVPLPRDS